MTEIDTDKLRALDEAARKPGLSMPGEPAWLIERDKRENARKQLAAALRESLPAILAMAEERKRSEKHRNDLADKITEQSVEIGALKAENKRLREALDEIRDLPGEINPSNYDHDDACELNRQFCYAIVTANEAISRMEVGHE